MNELAVFGFAPRTNLDLLALLIFDVAPVAAMKTQRALPFVEKLFQHDGDCLSVMPAQSRPTVLPLLAGWVR